MNKFIALISRLRALAIPGTAVGVFAAVDSYWESLSIWIFGEFPSDWVIDNLVLVPSWWPSSVAALASASILLTARNIWINRKLAPKISISEPKQYFMPWKEAQEGKRVNRHFYLTITNLSFGNLTGCSVTDAGFENNTGHVAPVKGRHFRLRSERGADASSHTYAKSLDLRGKGDDLEIDICSMDEGNEVSRVVMYYATSPTQQYPNAIVRELFPHYLTIRVTAENLANPETRRFKIYIEDNGDLKMEAA